MGTDHCAGSPCKHGACENINGGYFCNCDSGWEGKTCSDDFNECIHFGSSEWSLKQRGPSVLYRSIES